MMATSVWVCLSVLLLACVVAGEASTINGATSAADAIVLALGSTTTVRSTNTGPVYFRVTNAPADGRLAVDVVNKELYYPKLPSVVIKASEGMSIGSSPFVEHAWSAEQAILGVSSCDFTGGNWTISVEFQDETSSAVERVFEITAVSQAHDCEAWSWVYIIGVPAALLLCGVGILIFLARRRSPTPRARPRSVPTPGFELEAVSAKHLRPPAVDNRTASQRARFVESSRQPEESAALAEQLAHIARAPLPSAPAPQYATTAGTRRQYARSDLV